MCRAGETVTPEGDAIARFHTAKFEAYRTLQAAERRTRALMGEA